MNSASNFLGWGFRGAPPIGYYPGMIPFGDDQTAPGVFIADDPDQGPVGPGTGYFVQPESGFPEITPEQTIEDEGQANDAVSWQVVRYLQLSNQSKEKVKLSYKVESLNENNEWVWGETDTIELAAGEAIDLNQGDWQVNGRRAHIWGSSATRAFDRFEKADLWLVPEVPPDGDPDDHKYESQTVQTFTFFVQ